MPQDFLLPNLLQKYIDRVVGLEAVHGFVALKIGEVDDELVDLVSMEIWHFQDGQISENELRSRLALMLGVDVHNAVYFESLIPEEWGAETTT